jgi:hypothetical protein
MIINPYEYRIIFGMTSQLITAILSLIMVIQMIKRNNNKITKLLSSFYLSQAIGYFLLALVIYIQIDPIQYILYLICIYIILIGFPFIHVFYYSLSKLGKLNSNKYIISYICSCAILLFIFIVLYPGGIKISKSTGWIPIYPIEILIVLHLYLGIIFLSTLSYINKIYKKIHGELKKRIKYLIFGTTGAFILTFGQIVYNTWINNQLFRTVFPIISLILILPIIYSISFFSFIVRVNND